MLTISHSLQPDLKADESGNIVSSPVGLALVPGDVSGASCKVAVIVAPGVLGDDATVFAEDEELRAGPELAEGGIALLRSPARAQLIALPNH